MKFKIKDLENLLVCAERTHLSSIKIQQIEFELLISKETKQSQQQLFVDPKQSIKPAIEKSRREVVASNTMAGTQVDEEQHQETYFTIVSPMVGTFYRSPAPNEPYFIELHDNVTTNQSVCIVEAMKLMNEIEAEVSGQVVEILVENGAIIDCGQALMKIKPAN